MDLANHPVPSPVAEANALVARMNAAIAARAFNSAALASLSKRLAAYAADPFAGLDIFLREYRALIESELRAAGYADEHDLDVARSFSMVAPR